MPHVRPLHALTISILLSLFLALAAHAQKQGTRYADVKVWYGTYSYRISGTEPRSNGSDRIEASFEGTFTLTQNPKQPNWYDGNVESSRASVRFKGERKSNCTETRTLEADGPATNPSPSDRDPDVELRIYPDKWQVHQRKFMLKGPLRISGCSPARTIDSFVSFPPTTDMFPIPPSGSTLERKFEAKGLIAAIPDAPFQHASWTAEIRLSPTRDDFILEVASSDYDTWRPSAGTGGGAGSRIEFTATLKRKSGAPPGVEIERVEWELKDTSREPGIALNYPVAARDGDPDMRFDPKARQVLNGKEGQGVVTSPVNGTVDSAIILPFDWGGWTTLAVTATLRGGKKVVGTLQGTGEQEILVPKRRKGSRIADAWRNATPGANGADDVDDESDKAHGGRYTGDGLTLYEEYRGFIVKGAHVSGDPMKRELFVRNEVGPMVEGGIAKFAKESGIVVHRLEDKEFDVGTRIVNMNHLSGAHVVDQHGVRIIYEASAGSGGAAYATRWMGGKPGASPRDVRNIEVPRAPIEGPNAGDGTPYSDVSFAHEMMHTVGVRHHGKGDYDAEWEVDAAGQSVTEHVLDDEGARVGLGGRIRLFNYMGADVTALYATTKKGKVSRQLVGVQGGESSGDDTCMMRYDRNGAYVIPGRPGDRFLINSKQNAEPVGYRICTSSEGTGINAPPTLRYGNAQFGNCFSQIRVSDR